MITETALANLIFPGCTVAVGDGFGTPREVSAQLSMAAADQERVRLVLGWMPEPDPGLNFEAFSDVRTVMPGWGLRAGVASGKVQFVPTRLSAVPALIHGPLRPDVLVATVVSRPDGFRFATEVSWQRAAVAAGARIAAVISAVAPCADAGPPLPDDQLVVLGVSTAAPGRMPDGAPSPEVERMVDHLLTLIPAHSRIQVGPGALGATVLRRIEVPVRIDSGLLPDAIVDLDERGLLVDEPIATYLAGGPRLLDWADGRKILHPIEFTHDLGRLSASPLFAINTAIEVDLMGQVNVEGTARAIVGGIGGHADYTAAAARSIGGLSIVAVSTTHNGRSTLVAELSRPVSTPAHDVDVIVTEHGLADLRGLDRTERTRALLDLWGTAAPPQRS
ncbi:acetyl-CoA hydrolase/transferase C-terminal domain-containing protein [Nocardia sp. NBC_01388]|uniref:acetyl-CoA hydrolase/transferase C-terminal domain-containing protein n=1 Tax=Nocardia sp. NBC_01388 TaxID=2903596 RepID=UPI003249F84E